MLSTKKLATTEICKLLFVLTPFLPSSFRTSEEVRGTERVTGHEMEICIMSVTPK